MVKVSKSLPPSFEQKEGLMREVFEAFKQIPDNEDRALLIYYAIQAIHPYSEGNGRTGRLLHEIISGDSGELTEVKLSKLLDHDQGGLMRVQERDAMFLQKRYLNLSTLMYTLIAK